MLLASILTMPNLMSVVPIKLVLLLGATEGIWSPSLSGHKEDRQMVGAGLKQGAMEQRVQKE